MNSLTLTITQYQNRFIRLELHCWSRFCRLKLCWRKKVQLLGSQHSNQFRPELLGLLSKRPKVHQYHHYKYRFSVLRLPRRKLVRLRLVDWQCSENAVRFGGMQLQDFLWRERWKFNVKPKCVYGNLIALMFQLTSVFLVRETAKSKSCSLFILQWILSSESWQSNRLNESIKYQVSIQHKDSNIICSWTWNKSWMNDSGLNSNWPLSLSCDTSDVYRWSRQHIL